MIGMIFLYLYLKRELKDCSNLIYHIFFVCTFLFPLFQKPDIFQFIYSFSLFYPFYYYMRNFCNLIGSEQLYFSLI